jgi:mannose/cellobiose epimerase-like protein (N-acyl-D-glucosamine 2-epimerase family)
MNKHGKLSANAVGYAQLLSPENQIIEPKLDCYDFAFYLLACFHRFKTFNEQSALDEANALLEHIEKSFKDNSAGWLEGDYAVQERRQNPHMHLFEAFMTGYEVTQDAKWLAKAGQIFSLFEQFFFNPITHVLNEYFETNWQLADGPRGEVVEPGHMFEWVWLLRWYQQLTSTPVTHYCDALYQKALEIGCDPHSKLIYDVTNLQGDVINGTKRCWPLTELVKASLVQASLSTDKQRSYYEEKGSLGIQLLFDFYMHPTIKGSYIDQIALDNSIQANHAPASTLYHFMVMALEANKYARNFF